jgi:hypothetical protein
VAEPLRKAVNVEMRQHIEDYLVMAPSTDNRKIIQPSELGRWSTLSEEKKAKKKHTSHI